jgi:ubiquinone/menaquinone biosynthesis C-methylase UbiE
MRNSWSCALARRALRERQTPSPLDPWPLPLSENARVSRSPNFCAGSYGVIYDFCIERERLMRAVGLAAWGIDMSVFYASMEAIGRASDGATILDVPCGGGVAFRALRPDQDVRYIAADLSERMLERAQRRAKERSLKRVEFALADLCALPFADAQADLFLSYCGLHMLEDPKLAVREIGRCLKPGGELVGTSLLADGSRRQRTLFGIGHRLGYPTPPSGRDLRRWLIAAGIAEPTIERQRSFGVFGGRKRAG